MRRARYLVLGLFWIVGSGCRSSNIPPTAAASARVEQGVAEGFSASDKAQPRTFEVRHNPAACECPPFEVFAYGRWTRAFIDGSQTNLTALRAGDTLAVTKVNGRVEQKPRAAANGVFYLVLTAL